jgi:hypothetical protein
MSANDICECVRVIRLGKTATWWAQPAAAASKMLPLPEMYRSASA